MNLKQLIMRRNHLILVIAVAGKMAAFIVVVHICLTEGRLYLVDQKDQKFMTIKFMYARHH